MLLLVRLRADHLSLMLQGVPLHQPFFSGKIISSFSLSNWSSSLNCFIIKRRGDRAHSVHFVAVYLTYLVTASQLLRTVLLEVHIGVCACTDYCDCLGGSCC